MAILPSKKIEEIISSYIPVEAQIVKIQFEGPEVAVYVRRPEYVVENLEIVKTIAKSIKKRVVIRTDPKVRKGKEETKNFIKTLLKDLDVKDEDIDFDDVLGEVHVRIRKQELIRDKEAEIKKQIMIKTGWRFVPELSPSEKLVAKRSTILSEVLKYMLENSGRRWNILVEVGQRIHRPLVYKSNHVRITFLGGAKEVGRSAILVETAESRVLLDAGINPGSYAPLRSYPRIDIDGFDVENLDAVIISHAHLDHCGFLPFLFKYGYKGPVYATKPTRDLMVLLQRDYLDIAEKENKLLPYSLKQIKEMILHVIPLKYGEVTDIAPDIRLTLYNAGHILGSAIVHLHIGDGLHNIVYTSDFKFGPTRLLEKANYKFPRVETLIMESTYGTDELPPRDEAEAQLINIVKETIEKKGKVLIPVLSVGRGQEILLVLIDAIESGKLPKIPIYIEGMIDEVTAIHTAYPEFLSSSLRQKIEQGENPFEAEYIEVVDSREGRKEVVDSEEPVVIMATSGMLTGGPAVEYLKMLAPDPRNSLIFVSYQVEGTLGRKIKDGIREIPFITPEGKVEILRIKMRVESVEGFSGHSDRRQLIAFLQNIKPQPKRVILNHGEATKVHALARIIKSISEKKKLNLEVYIPNVMDSYRLA